MSLKLWLYGLEKNYVMCETQCLTNSRHSINGIFFITRHSSDLITLLLISVIAIYVNSLNWFSM